MVPYFLGLVHAMQLDLDKLSYSRLVLVVIGFYQGTIFRCHYRAFFFISVFGVISGAMFFNFILVFR